MKWLRSLAAVLAGYVILVITLRQMSGSLLKTLAIVITGAVFAGFVTAYVAGRREIPHAAALGLILIATSLGIRVAGQAGPTWPQMVVGGCGPIAAMVGAATRILTKPAASANLASPE